MSGLLDDPQLYQSFPHFRAADVLIDPYGWSPDWREHFSTNLWGHRQYFQSVAPYSTDLAAAYQLFEANQHRFHGISVEWRRSGADFVWRCKLVLNKNLDPGGVVIGYADTAPLLYLHRSVSGCRDWCRCGGGPTRRRTAGMNGEYLIHYVLLPFLLGYFVCGLVRHRR